MQGYHPLWYSKNKHPTPPLPIPLILQTYTTNIKFSVYIIYAGNLLIASDGMPLPPSNVSQSQISFRIDRVPGAVVGIASLMEDQGADPDVEELGRIPVAREQVPSYQ